jgi:uncharacterized NAD(P)/FAD-binding protein YdhS
VNRTEVAVVGLGPWGLATMERLVTVAQQRQTPLVIHVIEPGLPGAGIFSVDGPDYLPLNTPCGQHVMFPTLDHGERPRYAQSLYDWARLHGYRWVGDQCRRSRRGRPITPDDFLPQRLMGEWLHWSYTQLVASLPRWVSVHHHQTSATDVEPTPNDREVLSMANGETVEVDHVVLTTGHTPDEPDDSWGVHQLAPYPVTDLHTCIGPGESVAVAGLGLVAFDVIAALTVGRGGSFRESERWLRYRPSGREPTIHLFSRSGQPYAAKAVGATDPTGQYVPVICTPAAAARLRHSHDGRPSKGQVDFRRDFLPLILAEMQVRFYRQHALLDRKSEAAADDVTRDLTEAWTEGRFDSALEHYASRYGTFDVESHLLGPTDDGDFLTTVDYEKQVYATIEDDAAEAMSKEASPLKAAYETVRVLRDTMRSVIEFQGLDLDSYLDFQALLSNRFKAVVAGPPVRRVLELLALMDAGIVRIPWGPSPRVETAPDKGFVIGSTRLDEPFTLRVDHVVRGHLSEPTICGSRSPLIRALAGRGRIQPLRYGDVEVGSIALTEDSHPVGPDGEIQGRLWVFGSLTEGVRYFTQYVPSPKSRVRAFVDAEACAERILDSTSPGGDSRTSDLTDTVLQSG